MIGIDWGVKTIATTTDPTYDLLATGYGKRSASLLACSQRKMARRRPMPGKKSSNGHREAKKQTARIAKKVARQRKDTVVKWVKRVVDNHCLIAVENFKPAFLAKSSMARKAADNSIGLTKRELIYRAKRVGREVVMVSPAYTTMTCEKCLTRTKSRISLSQRIFLCWFCGHTADRDRNAAGTILATAGLYRVSADAVRHLIFSSEKRQMLAELGIPRL